MYYSRLSVLFLEVVRNSKSLDGPVVVHEAQATSLIVLVVADVKKRLDKISVRLSQKFQSIPERLLFGNTAHIKYLTV